MNLTQIRKQLDSQLANYQHIKRSYLDEDTILENTQDELKHAEEAQKILQAVAQSVQRNAHDRIAGVVTKCLQSVFEDKYEFKIEFEQKRGRTEAELLYVKNGVEIDPVDGDGGGVLDVSAFALRLVSVVLNKPALRRLLVMDEPMKCLSADHTDQIADLLTTLAEEMDIQMVIVTHNENLRCGRVIQL
jgi:DNA repair exonuclease SbcCD ATPase subunit